MHVHTNQLKRDRESKMKRNYFVVLRERERERERERQREYCEAKNVEIILFEYFLLRNILSQYNSLCLKLLKERENYFEREYCEAKNTQTKLFHNFLLHKMYAYLK